MTADADDAGLVGTFHAQMRRGAYTTAVATFTEIMKEVLENAEAQRREIEELRRERDIANEAWKGTRCAELREQARAEKAEAALAEALKVIAPFAKLAHMGDPDYDYDTLADGTLIMVRLGTLRAASAFVEKHGGQDG